MTNFSLQILFPLGPSMRISTVYDTGDHMVSKPRMERMSSTIPENVQA